HPKLWACRCPGDLPHFLRAQRAQAFLRPLTEPGRIQRDAASAKRTLTVRHADAGRAAVRPSRSSSSLWNEPADDLAERGSGSGINPPPPPRGENPARYREA